MIHDHSSLQVAVRRLVQMLDDMRERRDDFINTYTMLQIKLEQLENTTSLFCEMRKQQHLVRDWLLLDDT